MDRYKSLLKRQVVDIVNTIDKLNNAKSFIRDVSTMFMYSEELKTSIRKNISDQGILELVDNIPVVDVEECFKPEWHTFVFDTWLFRRDKNEEAKEDILIEIKKTRDNYYKLYQMLNSLAQAAHLPCS